MPDASVVIGGAGTALLLLAFVLNVSGRLRISWLYTSANMLGAGLAGFASYLIGFMPFVVLEAVWFLAAGAKLVNLARGRRRAHSEIVANAGNYP